MPDGRDALFALAVNRAAATASRLGAGDAFARRSALEVWYLKTRFAYRVPFPSVLRALAQRPAGTAHWEGGEDGGWRPGPPPQP